MDEVINKPDSQFKDILNDLVDYSKDSEEKSALIEEVCRSKHLAKPAASLNSSIYSSAASSSSSTSSASDSSANSASSSSTSSTLSSPSQSSQGIVKESMVPDDDVDKMEVAKLEDLGKTARILEHRIVHTGQRAATNGNGLIAVPLHSDRSSTSMQNNSLRSSLSSTSQDPNYKLTMQQHQQIQLKANPTQLRIGDNANHVTNISAGTYDGASTVNSWKTISGKRDKRRKRPTEQPVLSQHIPGHKGEQEVDWLVNFIESGAGTANTNTSKKNNKGAKVQSKRPVSQTTETTHNRDQQRKTNNNTSSSTNTKLTPRSRALQRRPSSSEDSDDPMTANHQPTDKRVLSTRASSQSHPVRQPVRKEADARQDDESKDGDQKPVPLQSTLNSDHQSNIMVHDEAAVTFADHIRLSDDDDLGERYTFGFFEDQPKRQVGEPVDTTKPASAHDKISNVTNSKSNHISQKHKSKHLKTSLNSEQKRYKCNDSVDTNSFNYHQILEFISNSWENIAKPHILTDKSTGA